MTSVSKRSTTTTVAQNTFWTGLEIALTIGGAFAITVATARVIGPRRLGYFNFIYWMMNITGSVAALGIPLTTLKYMSEYLGRGEHEIASGVFHLALRLQTLISFVITVIAVFAVLKFTLPEYRLISLFLGLSIVPQMMAAIPSQANVAAEELRANTTGAAVGAAVNVTMVTLSLVLGWDLLGIAIGVLLYRSAELAVKLIPVWRKTRDGAGVVLPSELRRRMFRFSGQGTALLLLQVIVWDRSDMIVLKLLQSDTRQLAFFSVPFSLVERLLLIPQPFARAFGATQMAESGRDQGNMIRLTGTATIYMLLLALPVFAGAVVMSGPAIRVIYGWQYLPAIPVFAVAALFGISKSLLIPPRNVLLSNEDLGFIIRWSVIAGAIDILLDLFLIPHYAALGACIGNGVGQTIAAGAIWIRAMTRFNVRINTVALGKIGLSTLIMAASAFSTMKLSSHAVVQLLSGTLLGAAIYIGLVRWFRVLTVADRKRLGAIGRRVPRRFQGSFDMLANFIAGPHMDEQLVM